MQWNLDITKGQVTGKICSLCRGSFSYIYHYWGKENRSLYRGLRYIEVRYIEVPLYLLGSELFERGKRVGIGLRLWSREV